MNAVLKVWTGQNPTDALYSDTTKPIKTTTKTIKK